MIAAEGSAPPLAGIRVLDLTAIVLGPLATLCLADLGADVVKVEAPGGDGTRGAGTIRHPGMSATFLTLNRNKRSLALDLKHPQGRAVLGELARGANVVVHNMRPEAARRLGIDAPTLRAQNPRLIHCAASGFAQGGERADDPAVDDVIQAGSGLAALCGADGEPRYVPSLIADKVCGLVLAQAVLAALLSRERTGEGRTIELPMLETMASFTLLEHLGGAAFVPPVGPAGYGRLTTPHRRPMKTRDGHIALTPYTARHWTDFFMAAGRPDLAADPRLTDPARRNAEVGELYALLAAILPERDTAEWFAIARTAGVPVSPVERLEDIARSQALFDRGVLVMTDHPSEGRTVHVGPLVPGIAVPHRPAPTLGQDGADILAELGWSAEAIARLRSDGVLVEAGSRPGHASAASGKGDDA